MQTCKCNILQQLVYYVSLKLNAIMVIFCNKYLNCICNRSLSAATTPLIQQRALEGLPAAQRSRGSRVAEPPPTPPPLAPSPLHGTSMRCFRLLEDEGACLNVPHQAEEEAELMRRADRQPSTDTSPQRLWAADNHEEPLQGAERFTWGRLSAEAEWRGVGGDLWPLRILFWRTLSDDRTVRMRMYLKRTTNHKTKSGPVLNPPEQLAN